MSSDVAQDDCEGLDVAEMVAEMRQGDARPHRFQPLSQPLPDFRSWFIEILTAMKKNPSTVPDAEVQIKCHYDQWLWHRMYLKGMSVADVLEWAEERIDYVTWQEWDAVQGFQRVVPLSCEGVKCEGGGK